MIETIATRSREPVEIDDPLRDKEQVGQVMLEGLQNEPFKKLFADRDSTFLMPAGALKVWMYMYRCERENRRSRPSLETLCKRLNMNRATIIKWRKWLADNGWLVVLEKAYRREDGKWSVPVFRVTRPESSPRTAASNPRQYSEFFCKRDKVFLLPPSQFKIWLFRLRLERSRRRESWMRNSELAEKLGLDISTIRLGQEAMVKTGWLLERGKRFIGATDQTLTVYSVAWDGEIPNVQDERQGYNMEKARKSCKMKVFAEITASEKSRHRV